jgi:hypothetical protein
MRNESRISDDIGALLWRCPSCGMSVAIGLQATLHPPTCFWHGEMEQVTAEAFLAPYRPEKER